MKTQWARFLAIVVLSCLAATLCAAAPPKSSKRVSKATSAAAAAARKAIEERIAKEGKALERKDYDGASVYETPDHETVDADGNVVDKDIVRERTQQALDKMEEVKTTYAITSFILQQNKVTLKTHETVSGKIQDPQQKAHLLEIVSDEEAIWVKGPKGWLEKRSRIIHQEATLDGVNLPASSPDPASM